MLQLIKMAYRDLGRNRRRSFFSSLALGMGLALLLLMASFIQGEMGSAMETTIELQSGHLQIQAQDYDEIKTSLKWEDLVENPNQVAGQVASLEQVSVATPRLFATGIVSLGEDTAGVKVVGIDPGSSANDPFREGLVKGEFLSFDDREGILIGRSLADKLGLDAGGRINLSVNTSNGDVNDQPFIVRGIYTTETNAFDNFTVFVPLPKLQAMTQTENHASTIFVMLTDKDQTDSVAAALQSSSYKVLTWTKMNEFIIQYEDLANSYMVIMYLIVLGITATVIVNTLVMAVFERTREIGILSAIGMRSRTIMAMFLAESSLLAVGGIIIGLVLGSLAAAYLSKNGFNIESIGVTGMLLTNTIYTKLTMEDAVQLTAMAFVVTMLAGIFPAILAARMQPIEALRGGK